MIERHAVLLATVLAAVPGWVWAEPGDTDVVSVGYATGRAVGGESSQLWDFVSGDGRYVLFRSTASTLVPGDTNGRRDFFVRDRLNGRTQRVNVSTSGAQSNATQDSRVADMSSDGRYVAFESSATNLVLPDTESLPEIFLRDLNAGTTERISANSAGEPANGDSFGPSISDDGRFVTFMSVANNLDPRSPTTRAVLRIYVRDRVTRQTTLASPVLSGDSLEPYISGDGRFVVYYSAGSFVPDDVGSFDDVYIFDRVAGTTELVSRNSNGTVGNDSSFSRPMVTPGGRYVVFTSLASNLVTGDTNDNYDVFVRDRQLGRTEQISVATDGRHGNNRSTSPAISADGRFVTFVSSASNLVPGDTNNEADAFVRDRESGTTVRLGAGIGAQTITPDGRFVGFESAARLAPNDANDLRDVYVHELDDGAPPPEDTAFTLKPASLEFGERPVGSSTTLSLWLRNKGTAPLAIAEISVRGPDGDQFNLARGCGATLAVGAGCAINVTFEPTTAGSKNARLRLMAGDGERRVRELSGTGL
jgi:Tol biopolymer transport system component